jgi:hypothetical protein
MSCIVGIVEELPTSLTRRGEALLAAAEFSPFVRAPFHIISAGE